jgi:hypothetical protein
MCFEVLELSMKLKSCYFILMVMASVSSGVQAKWEQVSEGNVTAPEQYIELDTVKQTGPMSIYRQVKVLSQGAALNAKIMSSKVELFEYDCMSSKLRLLKEYAYSEYWAAGDEQEIVLKPTSMHEWEELPKNSLGKQTFDMLCPSGKDD